MITFEKINCWQENKDGTWLDQAVVTYINKLIQTKKMV